MKKSILAVLFVFALIFVANAHGAEVVLPDPNAKLSETVDIEPVSALLTFQPFEYRIRRGDNLTNLAKTFGTTVDELQGMNEGNPDVKNRDLILAGGKLYVPLYSLESIEKLAEFYDGVAAKKVADAQKSFDGYKRGSLVAIVALVLTLIVLVAVLLSSGNQREKVVADFKQEKQDLEKKLWEANDQREAFANEQKRLGIQLSLANEQLRLKEGADEEIKRLKADNDEFVEKTSELYMDKNALSVNLANTHARVEELETILRQKVTAGDRTELDSRDHGKVSLVVLKAVWNKKEGKNDVFVECPEENCLVNADQSLKKENALSHMSNSNHWPEK